MMYRFLLAIITLSLFSCDNKYVPKPLAYNRIDIPENVKHTQVLDACAYQSKVFNKAKIKGNKQNECWNTISYPNYNADVFLTYFPISDSLSLAQLLDEMHQLSFDHQQMANAIDVQSKVLKSGNMLLEYNIQGDAATPYQFCITDSSSHYLRGALYFNNSPNYDSVYPVLKFLKQEMELFLDSLNWKD